MTRHPSRAPRPAALKPATRLLLLTLFVFVLAQNVGRNAEAADPCAGAQATLPRVQVHLKRGPTVYHTDRTREEIAVRKGRRGGSVGASWKPVGLTVADIKFVTRIKVQAVARDAGRLCVVLTEVQASMGFDKLDVYISNTFKQGSCPYQTIYEHENKHVGIFHNTVTRYVPLLRDKLEAEVRLLRPIAASSIDQAARLFKSRLHGRTKSLFDDMNKALDQANAILDTPGSYALERARCDKW